MDYQKIDLEYQNRINVFRSVDEVPGEPEMSEFESAFLAGIIKKIKPKKVIEIGVAAGGTTAIILDSLEMYSNGYSLYSLDINMMFYRDKSKKTGFLADQYKKNSLLKNGSHNLIAGKYAPESIKVIGHEIDLMIIDTVHVLPGEILDFIAFLPFLASDAYVVLHDTNLNHKGIIRPNRSYATKLLFDLIQADKYINFDSSEDFQFPNIAAFKINQNTSNSIFNLISSLTISWEYFPTETEIAIYTDVISNNYEPSVIELWNRVIEQQRITMRPKDKHHIKYHSINVKNGSFIHWVHLIQLSTKYLFENAPKSLILKIYKKNRN